ncbi:MAG TPA: hypothetical protein VIJ40_02130 [Acidimicrobiales bacterium]
MALQERLHVQSMTIRNWLDMGHSPTAAHNGDAFTLVLDGVQQLREIPGRIGRTDLSH